MFNYGTQNYLKEQSIAEIIKNAFRVYKDYFREIFFSYAVLVLPFYSLSLVVAFLTSDAKFILLGYVINFLVGTVTSMAITGIVSDVCLGNPPGIVKAYKRLSIKSIGKLVGTTLLSYLAFSLFTVCVFLPAWLVAYLAQGSVIAGGILIGCIGLWIVGFIALVVLMLFYPPIVILEKRWGFNALKRSVKLGHGYYLRSFVVVALMFLLVVIGFFVQLLVQLIASQLAGVFLGSILGYLPTLLIYPMGIIYVVLMYYDLRVRKEGYDTETLAAELRR
jgi:hypothetical protein